MIQQYVDRENIYIEAGHQKEQGRRTGQTEIQMLLERYARTWEDEVSMIIQKYCF